MKITTHNGAFHPDDLFAAATLLEVYPGAEVIRTRDERVIRSADIAVDVGREYDPARLRFDHHQPEGAGKRENGIPYASFGLVWKEYGEKVCGGREASEVVEEKLVMAIDAVDNGVPVSTPNFGEVTEYTIADYLGTFASVGAAMEELDQAFFKALVLAQEILKREIAIAHKKVLDWQKVREIYESSEDKEIIVLPEQISWKKVLIPSEAKYVISPRPDGKWQIRAVPLSLTSFELKKPINGIESLAEFVHRDKFLAITDTKEKAEKLAEIALQNDQ